MRSGVAWGSLALCLAAGAAHAHEDAKLHAAIDGDVATLSAAARNGDWQRCLELTAEGQRLARERADFEDERLARREALAELATAADAAGAAHRAASDEHGVTSEPARATRDTYARAIAEHEAEAAAYDDFLRPYHERVRGYERRRTELERVCTPLEAAEARWAGAREQLGPWCEEYGQRLRRTAAGQMLATLGDPGAKARAQTGIDRELALHNCLHPAKAVEYERALSEPGDPD